jgi:hypothetical protein
MPGPTRAVRRRWWGVIAYEVQMFRAMSSSRASHQLAQNALAESLILHARNLCDFCLSPDPNDITLRDLFDNLANDSKYANLRKLTDRLDKKYGRSKNRRSARWAFNKKLAHPTKERSTHYEYTPRLNRVRPTIFAVIDEIESLRRRKFP